LSARFAPFEMKNSCHVLTVSLDHSSGLIGDMLTFVQAPCVVSGGTQVVRFVTLCSSLRGGKQSVLGSCSFVVGFTSFAMSRMCNWPPLLLPG
jgi:hypothetical protein